jgi:serine/threonine protein phosphatase 1
MMKTRRIAPKRRDLRRHRGKFAGWPQNAASRFFVIRGRMQETGRRELAQGVARHHFIGDVHGMSAALDALMTELAPAPDDVVVFLGDLVDRGPDSIGVVCAVRRYSESAAFEVVLIEGNHEEQHRRYRRNLVERPEVAAEQAARNPELEALTAALTPEDFALLDSAVPFYRLAEHDILAVHGGIPGDMVLFPASVGEAEALTGKERRAFSKVLRTRFIARDSGAFIMRGHEAADDPFWAERYDGRFGHVVFGHTPFMDGPARFAHATGIDTGAAHGGSLTALSVDSAGAFRFVSVEA